MDIAECDFNSLYLDGADVSGANLDNVRFGVSCTPGTLAGMRAAGAQLPNANLQKAHITHASFIGVNLSSANLSDADRSGTTMRGTFLENAVMPNVNVAEGRWEELSASGVDLRKARLAVVEAFNGTLVGWVKRSRPINAGWVKL